MALKVMVKQMKLLFLSVRDITLVFAVPFLFRAILPGFSGGAFPAVLIAYVLLGVYNLEWESGCARAGLLHFPVTRRDHLAGLFLFDAAIVMMAGALAAAFVRVSGPERFLEGVVVKSLGIGLPLAGVITCACLRLPPRAARIFNMFLSIFTIVMAIFQEKNSPVFLPGISAPAALLAGAGGFLLAFTLALRFPREA